MSLKEEVRQLIVETLEVTQEELVEGKKLYESIGVDSTEMVELVVALNKHFGVKVQASEVTKDSTPEDIVKVIEEKKQ